MAVFTISIDFELIWGVFDTKNFEFHKKSVSKERIIVKRLLELFEKYDVPVTWATVGHVFLNSCKKDKSGKAHPDMLRFKPNHFKEDWYVFDPCTSREKDPLWYGDDLVQSIVDSSIDHDIGGHSFSHIDFSKANKKVARNEFTANREVAKKEFNLDLKSFIFPRNKVNHLLELKKSGFSIFRNEDRLWFRNFKGLFYKLAFLFDYIFALTPPTYSPKVLPNSLVEVEGSMIYLSMDGLRRYIPIRSRIKKAKRGIDKAIKRDEHFHLWFHPFNLASEMDTMFYGLEEILKYAKGKNITIQTMRDTYEDFRNI